MDLDSDRAGTAGFMNFHRTLRGRGQYPRRAAVGLRLRAEVIGRRLLSPYGASEFLAIRAARHANDTVLADRDVRAGLIFGRFIEAYERS
jgi:hypothetical protein